MRQIAEHSHYVQGVAWDPLNEYFATQSSDRAVHVWAVTAKHGGHFDAHQIGRNARMQIRHARTPSRKSTAPTPQLTTSRPRPRKPAHSVRIVRKPIDACTAMAATKIP